MSASHSLKQKRGNHNDSSWNKYLEGTSARTRPLSFDDIMLRRKNSGVAVKQVADGSGVSDIALAGEIVEKARNSPESDRKKNDNSTPKDSRRSTNDSRKLISRRKTDASPSKNCLIQDRDKRSHDHESSTKLVADKNAKGDRLSLGKYERHHHSKKRQDVHRDDHNNGSDVRQSRDLVRKDRVSGHNNGSDVSQNIDLVKNDRVSERPRVKSEITRERLDNGDGHLHPKRKTDCHISSVPEDGSEKRNAGDVMWTDKLGDRRKEKSEKETRRKHHNEDDKTRGRSMGKKHDSKEQGSELKGLYLEESRSKRRRSGSTERQKERDTSPSHSPSAHKRASKNTKEHGELSSHSAKNRARIEHSDVENKRLSVSGSSSHYKRNTGSSSGLGGYSPRKRKSDSAAKTPSPTHRSPEKRNAGWDLQPVGKESIIASSALFNVHTLSQIMSLEIKEFPSGTPMTQSLAKPVLIPHHTSSSKIHAIESVQLTQATRPLRRLYAENLPASASEKDLMECINKFLLSSGVNYIQGAQPCISCIIHEEKGQALLEFLTPEDASAALSFHGILFSGSNLKLRRPKDYTDVTTGPDDKSVVAIDTVCDIVEDSPHKIFIGGISKLVSSQMLLEIAKAFGYVRAYHFEFIADSNELCAFLEYVDHSVTSKACAGLNGLKLGGQVITAVFATPDAVLVENVGKPPFYGIPGHAKQLLENPTTILMLKNMLDPEELLTWSESDLEEILEDIRLECTRYGTVKSINVAKPINSIYNSVTYETKGTDASTDVCDLDVDDKRYVTEQLGEIINELEEHDRSEPSETLFRSENNIKTTEDIKCGDNRVGISKKSSGFVEPARLVRSGVVGDSLSGYLIRDEKLELLSDDGNSSTKDPSSQETGVLLTEELAVQQSASVNELEGNIGSTGSIPVVDNEIENKPFIGEDVKLENAETQNAAKLYHDERMGASEEADRKDMSIDLWEMFEPGSVFVEFRRAEAACMAAHCLNGRKFDGRVVTVGYIGHDLYHMRFRR